MDENIRTKTRFEAVAFSPCWSSVFPQTPGSPRHMCHKEKPYRTLLDMASTGAAPLAVSSWELSTARHKQWVAQARETLGSVQGSHTGDTPKAFKNHLNYCGVQNALHQPVMRAAPKDQKSKLLGYGKMRNAQVIESSSAGNVSNSTP